MTEVIEIAVAAVGVGLLVLAVRQGRAKGAAAALQMAAFGFLLAGASAIGIVGFLVGIALSPIGWAGVGFLGLSGLLFFIGQGLEGRGGGKAKKSKDEPEAVAGGGAPAVEQGKGKPAGSKQSGGEEDFSDIEDILRKHGIE